MDQDQALLIKVVLLNGALDSPHQPFFKVVEEKARFFER